MELGPACTEASGGVLQFAGASFSGVVHRHGRGGSVGYVRVVCPSHTCWVLLVVLVVLVVLILLDIQLRSFGLTCVGCTQLRSFNLLICFQNQMLLYFGVLFVLLCVAWATHHSPICVQCGCFFPGFLIQSVIVVSAGKKVEITAGMLSLGFITLGLMVIFLNIIMAGIRANRQNKLHKSAIEHYRTR